MSYSSSVCQSLEWHFCETRVKASTKPQWLITTGRTRGQGLKTEEATKQVSRRQAVPGRKAEGLQKWEQWESPESRAGDRADCDKLSQEYITLWIKKMLTAVLQGDLRPTNWVLQWPAHGKQVSNDRTGHTFKFSDSSSGQRSFRLDQQIRPAGELNCSTHPPELNTYYCTAHFNYSFFHWFLK